MDTLKFGIEFGALDSKLAPNGVLGISTVLAGVPIGFLSMSAEL